MHKTERYRSVFLSDFHMGAKSFDAEAVLDFLKSVECQYLFLVGDIIDGWKLHKRWHWPESYNRILDEFARKAHKGTKIIYLPGNHDDEVRHIMPLTRRRFARRYGIKIKERTIHTMADGREFLVLHGDQFDRKILKGPLSKWSDQFYDLCMDILGGYRPPKVKVNGKIKNFSLAKSLAKHGQWALHLLNNFEAAVYKTTVKADVDGLICGHTHIPVLKPIKDIVYANAGSWLRSGHTALIETHDGILKLIDWPASHEQPTLFDPVFQHEPKQFKIVPDSSRYRAVTNAIVSSIRQTWPVTQPPKSTGYEWLEIESRDNVTLKTFHGLVSHAISRAPTEDRTTTIQIKPNKPHYSEVQNVVTHLKIANPLAVYKMT